MSLDIARLEEAPHLIDLLIQMEDVLDSLDLYVFESWMSGIIVAGPTVRPYWLQMTLEYPYDRKPDERGALRLVKHGLQCSISKGKKGERRTTASAPTTAPAANDTSAPLSQFQKGTSDASSMGDMTAPLAASDAAARSSANSADVERTDAIWLVELKIPRRLITDHNAAQLDFYDDEIDTEDVQDASDAGMTDETGYVDSGGQVDPADQDELAGAPAGAPPEGANAPVK